MAGVVVRVPFSWWSFEAGSLREIPSGKRVKVESAYTGLWVSTTTILVRETITQIWHILSRAASLR